MNPADIPVSQKHTSTAVACPNGCGAELKGVVGGGVELNPRYWCDKCHKSFSEAQVFNSMRGEDRRVEERREAVNHPQHYGGDTVYEAIKVIRAWGLGVSLGNVVKYICRAGKKGSQLEDLKKARWYLDNEINARERDEGASETTS